MKTTIKFYYLVILFVFTCNLGNTQINDLSEHIKQDEYQFSVGLSFQQPNGTLKKTTNYLWIPTSCKKIKAIIITSQNVLEQWLNEHPKIRKVCTDNDIAILWSCPGFFIDIKDKSKQVNGKNIQIILDSLSQITGYNELSHVPWISIGHSGTNNLVSELVYHYPQKILTAIKMKGGPGFDPPTTSFQMNDSSNKIINYSIPFLCNAGEYFEWNQQHEDLIHPYDTIKNYQNILMERKLKEQPLSYFFDPNTGHFECSEALTGLIANYIDAAVKTRISNKNDSLLIPIDKNKGWIAGLPLPGGELIKPKPYYLANEEEKSLPWFFSKKQAEDAIALSNVNFKRKAQIAGFSNLDGSVAQFNRGIVWPIPYETQQDGVTFKLNPVFWKAIPDTFQYAGTLLGKSENKPKVILLCGNAKKVGINTFKLTPERSYKAAATYFIVRTEGDKEYRTSVEPGSLLLTPNDKGMTQKIIFDSIPNVHQNCKRIQLKASSTASMPVSFYIKSGPAYLKNNNLIFTPIPPRTKFPILITVVAYQWGRSQTPQVQTAQSIERTFYITK